MPWKAHQAKIPVDFLNYMYIDHNHEASEKLYR